MDSTKQYIADVIYTVGGGCYANAVFTVSDSFVMIQKDNSSADCFPLASVKGMTGVREYTE